METVQVVSRFLFWIVPVIFVVWSVYRRSNETVYEDGSIKEDTRPTWLRSIQAVGAGLFVFAVWTYLLGNPDVLNGVLSLMSNGQR